MSPQRSAPLARDGDDLIVVELSDELLIYDRSSYKAHCLNITASLIWKNCNGRSTVADLAHRLSMDQDVIVYGINQLSQRGLLRAKLDYPKISRRDLIRSAAIISVLPLITTITAPNAQAQASGGCGRSGAECTFGPACCAGCACATDPDGIGRHCLGIC